MNAETNAKIDLQELLATMTPQLQPGEFVFCTLDESSFDAVAKLEPLGCFQEEEGMTVIIPLDNAKELELEYSDCMRLITLKVHSSLQAVGFTAAVSAELAKHGISANVVAAYHHDHIFVSSEDGESAASVLRALSSRSRGELQIE